MILQNVVKNSKGLSAIKELIESNSDAMIEIIQGSDELCKWCPDCREDRCESPNGMKIKLENGRNNSKRAGISYGEKRTIQELREIIDESTTRFLRTRCPWKAIARSLILGESSLDHQL